MNPIQDSRFQYFPEPIIPRSPNDLTHNSFRPLVVNNMAHTRTMKMNSAPFPAQGKDSEELSLEKAS